MLINMAGKSDVGRKRANNEDCFLIRPEAGFCLLADGMGGEAAGEIASAIFAHTALELFALHGKGLPHWLQKAFTWIKTLSNVQKRYDRPLDEIHFNDKQEAIQYSEKTAIKLIEAAFSQANRRILRYAKKNEACAGMGCTAEMIVFINDGYLLGHIGDSRVYRLQKNKLVQLTSDHTVFQENIDKGFDEPPPSQKGSGKNILVKAMGVENQIVPDIKKGKIESGDLFLLCSDGLTDRVDDMMIQRTLGQPSSLAETTVDLISHANNAGGHDNITVVLIELL